MRRDKQKEIDNILEEIAGIVGDSLGVNIKVINANDNEEELSSVKSMFEETKQVVKDTNNWKDADIQDAIKKLTCVIYNASLLDKEDLKHLTKEEYQDYLIDHRIANGRLHNIMSCITAKLDRFAVTFDTDEEDLTKLTKEELIERLRKK